MREEKVSFYSEGDRVVGFLRLPDDPGGAPYPGIVQGPGWLGIAESKGYALYHERLVTAGFAVLVFNYRGWVESEGEAGLVVPSRQHEDIRNAITYMQSREEIDENRVGLFGVGGTGAGNAVYVAAVDKRVKCVVVNNAVANGADWFRAMRREYEWVEFCRRVERNHVRRVLENETEVVNPLGEFMIETPERQAAGHKRDVAHKIPTEVPLWCAEKLLDFVPEEVAHRIAPAGLMLVGVSDDVVTPLEHTRRIYERAGAPKKMLIQLGTTHYGARKDLFEEVMPHVVDWYRRHLSYTQVLVEEVPLPDGPHITTREAR